MKSDENEFSKHVESEFNENESDENHFSEFDELRF
jgi:hypothetical protein